MARSWKNSENSKIRNKNEIMQILEVDSSDSKNENFQQNHNFHNRDKTFQINQESATLKLKISGSSTPLDSQS